VAARTVLFWVFNRLQCSF